MLYVKNVCELSSWNVLKDKFWYNGWKEGWISPDTDKVMCNIRITYIYTQKEKINHFHQNEGDVKHAFPVLVKLKTYNIIIQYVQCTLYSVCISVLQFYSTYCNILFCIYLRALHTVYVYRTVFYYLWPFLSFPGNYFFRSGICLGYKILNFVLICTVYSILCIVLYCLYYTVYCVLLFLSVVDVPCVNKAQIFICRRAKTGRSLH